MPTRCTEAATCSCIRNSWPVPTREGKPDKPDRTSGRPLASLKPSRSPKLPRLECASKPPWGYARRSTPFAPKKSLALRLPVKSRSRVGQLGHSSLFSFRRPQWWSLRSGLNTRSTWRFNPRMTPIRANPISSIAYVESSGTVSQRGCFRLRRSELG